MKQFLMFTCFSIMIPTTIIAEETTQTCANGTGTIVIGAITGHKYCKSNVKMNWWNAVSWCDAQGRRLFNLNDCGCSDTIANCAQNCPEVSLVIGMQNSWTTSFKKIGYVDYIDLYNGHISPWGVPALTDSYFALCK